MACRRQEASTVRPCAGKELRSDNIDLEANHRRYGKRGCLLGWYEVQQAFNHALPPKTVTFGSRCRPMPHCPFSRLPPHPCSHVLHAQSQPQCMLWVLMPCAGAC